MRCEYCGTKNIKRARYCSCCGAELPQGRRAFASDSSGQYWLTALCCAAALALVFLAVSIIVKNSKSGGDTEANADTPVPTVLETAIYSRKPTLPPLLTPTPTPAPTPAPTPTPKPRPPILTPSPSPTAVPSAAPSMTAGIPRTAEPTSEYVFNGPADLEPVDALCGFILYGEAAYARKAFPPEYVAFIAKRYGFAVSLLGSEDAVIEYAGNIMTANYKAKYGNITSIDRVLASYKVLTKQELERLCAKLPEYGMNNMPTAAHVLTVDLVIYSDQGVFYERVMPHVLLIDGAWYIDPEDINM